MVRYVPFELDKTRNLRFGMQALMKVEKALGTSLASVDFSKDMKYETIATILCAGLSHEDASLTPEKVAMLIDDHSDIKTAMGKMTEAMEAAFGTSPNEIPETGEAITLPMFQTEEQIKNGTGMGLAKMP